MGNIVVQLADPEWTMQALHLASALARNTGSYVTLLHLALARNPGLLGTELATPAPSWEEWAQFREYGSVCGDYGGEFVFQPMQYVTLTGAIRDAATMLEATAFFIKQPDSRFRLWNRFVAWRLEQVLRPVGCRLYFVDAGTCMIDWSADELPAADVEHALKSEVWNC